MRLLNNKQERLRFLKFAFVGVTGTIVDFGIMNLMSLVFGVPLVWAQIISFSLALINNFLWNRFWTYPESRSKAAHRQLLQFILINIVGILVRTPLVPWFDRIILNLLDNGNVHLRWDNFIISQNLALAAAIGIVFLWNYFANRYWTYADIPTDDTAPVEDEGSPLRKES